ncbi:hypothetical protein ACUNI7_19985, partial [Serratia sp. IR-2025]
SGLRARDGRNVVAEAIYAEVVEPLLAANREAQPVAWEMRYWNSGYNIWGDWERITAEQHAEMSVKFATDNDYEFRVLYDAPPAPAVPDAVDYSDLDATSQDREVIEAIAECKGWNAYRAAMLAQPVSSGYKLVPAEATEDMIAAAMNCDDVSFNADETFCVNFGNIYAAMLAAAPEGGNDHDTRR